MNKLILLIITIITLNSCGLQEIHYTNKTGSPITIRGIEYDNDETYITYTHDREIKANYRIDGNKFTNRFYILEPYATVEISITFED